MLTERIGGLLPCCEYLQVDCFNMELFCNGFRSNPAALHPTTDHMIRYRTKASLQ